MCKEIQFEELSCTKKYVAIIVYSDGEEDWIESHYV